jgi:hypothetical protein
VSSVFQWKSAYRGRGHVPGFLFGAFFGQPNTEPAPSLGSNFAALGHAVQSTANGRFLERLAQPLLSVFDNVSWRDATLAEGVERQIDRRADRAIPCFRLRLWLLIYILPRWCGMCRLRRRQHMCDRVSPTALVCVCLDPIYQRTKFGSELIAAHL